MKYSIGVDLGGTHVRSIIVNEKLKIIKRKDISLNSKNKSEILDKIFASINSVISGIDNKKINGIGVGVPGIINKNKLKLPNLPELNINLKKLLEKRFKLRVMVKNDGSCAALGEFLKFYKSKKISNLVFLTLGTGVGGGIIINSKLYEGSGRAGEFSHTSVEAVNGSLCSCGNIGCLEEYISIRGIKRVAKRSGLKERNILDIAKKANKGDYKAEKVFDIAGEYLGIGLSNIVKVLDPQIIVLGGGISKSGKILLNPAIKEMKKRTFFKTPKVALSRLKDDAVAFGSATLFL